MKLDIFRKNSIAKLSLIVVILAANWFRIHRPDVGYSIATTFSYYVYGGYVDHHLTETLIISFGGSLIGGYASWVVFRVWRNRKPTLGG